jgi:hypothetical protein
VGGFEVSLAVRAVHPVPSTQERAQPVTIQALLAEEEEEEEVKPALFNLSHVSSGWSK